MESSLNGRTAVVTGGAKGIGAAVVRRLSRDGANVVIADIDEENGRKLAAECGRALFVRCDVSQEAQVLAVLDAAEAEFGRIDILVNDAAWQLNKPLLETTTEEFERVMGVNVVGSFVFLRETAKRMIAKGTPGAIVNFASTFAVVGSPGYLAYHASKGAIASMTRAAAVALLPHGIRVNAVAPGTVDTPGLHDGARDTGDEARGLAGFLALQPLKRFGRPEEIANVVRFLAGDEASFVHGAVVMADGGYTVV
ncbi:MAG: SDR family oxidoreductase [Lentisphaeria bacterium]|nr:SDR family oxidoreductase [Lentisphaeria bacterium]